MQFAKPDSSDVDGTLTTVSGYMKVMMSPDPHDLDIWQQLRACLWCAPSLPTPNSGLTYQLSCLVLIIAAQ